MRRLLVVSTDNTKITQALNRIADRADTGLDDFGKEAARRTLVSIEWDDLDDHSTTHQPRFTHHPRRP